MNEFDWSFVKSTRFYGNLLVSTGVWLKMPDAFTWPGFGTFLIAIGTLFVVTKTIDRTVDAFSVRLPVKTETKTITTQEKAAGVATAITETSAISNQI